MRLYTHLNFGGNCEEAFRFYAEHLDGQVTTMFRVRDLPAHVPPPPVSPETVIHARLSLAGVELIGNDVPPEQFQPVRSSYLYLSLDSIEAAERVYAVLAEGGKIAIPLGETFFAPRFAQLCDQFGTLWTVLYREE